MMFVVIYLNICSPKYGANLKMCDLSKIKNPKIANPRIQYLAIIMVSKVQFGLKE